MASLVTAQHCFVSKTKEEQEHVETSYARYRDIISTLPKEKGWVSVEEFRQYQGFWFRPMGGLEGIMWVQHHFKARSTDILLVSTPKSGTTWLKALMFSIMNRTRFDYSTHPLLTTGPHECVPFMEHHLFRNTPIGDPEIFPSPRLLATHIPYSLLPESITNSGCRVVYICRNPKDVFVSMWHFINKLAAGYQLPPCPLEQAFNLFCRGISGNGPYWDHVLGYWKASLGSPNTILFVKYEDMKNNTLAHAKKLAKFLGQPFSLQEEEAGIVQQILDLCSFENMRNLEVNKSGTFRDGIRNEVFFRQGKIGDWENHLTPQMNECLDRINEHKFSEFGLSF